MFREEITAKPMTVGSSSERFVRVVRYENGWHVYVGVGIVGERKAKATAMLSVEQAHELAALIEQAALLAETSVSEACEHETDLASPSRS